MKYTTNHKQVLRNGEHFADAIDPGAAVLIADTLNARGERLTAGPTLADAVQYGFDEGRDMGSFDVTLDDYVGPWGGGSNLEHARKRSEELGMRPTNPDLIRAVRDVGNTQLCNTTHTVSRQQDEYACSCGVRWDVADGSEHP